MLSLSLILVFNDFYFDFDVRPLASGGFFSFLCGGKGREIETQKKRTGQNHTE